MTTLRVAATAAIVLALLGAPDLTAQSAGRGEAGERALAGLRTDVAAGNEDWIAGLKAGDARRMTRAYAPDAVFCGASGACIQGAAAIAAHYQDVVRRFGRATSASVQSAALRADGNLAFESGRAEARFPDGRVVQGRYSTVWKRQPDGHWRIFRNMSL